MLSASQLRTGMVIRFEGQPYRVISCDYRPGQGQMGGAAHARLLNLATGTFWEHSFRAELKLDELPVERRSMTFLYSDEDHCWFMDPESFEQVGVPNAILGRQIHFLAADMHLPVEFMEGNPIAVVFPDVVEVRVADTAPSSHQQQDTNWKPATLENGTEISVPQFIKSGEWIRLDLNQMRYMDRAKMRAH
jgi:elongation factor P